VAAPEAPLAGAKPSKDMVQASFEEQAARFGEDTYYGSPGELAYLRQRLALAPGLVVLDVACGPGWLTRALLQPGSRLVGVDFAGPMLRRVPREVAAVQGDAERLPFRSATFDAVVTRLSFHHFLRPEAILAEMVRVARLGGAVAGIDLLSPTDPAKARLYNRFEKHRDPAHVHALALKGLTGLFQLSGLEVERVETWRWKRDFEEWLRITSPGEQGRREAEALLRGPLWQDGGSVNGRLEAGRLVFDHHFGLVVGRKR
jgi:ubiquinone/menaquinone biosynthesis C-methylase UbiE